MAGCFGVITFIHSQLYTLMQHELRHFFSLLTTNASCICLFHKQRYTTSPLSLWRLQSSITEFARDGAFPHPYRALSLSLS